ncbi:hypothetical protein [Acinetobacter modestus]|uniref:hypothetical protein n=1 Tax=Acinetobacter modestus TaxID=1776740 RepID=UPI0030184DE5
MNDFFLVNNESLSHMFVDRNIQVMQIQVKNLNQFAFYAEPIKALDVYSIEMTRAVIDEHIVKIMGLCSMVTTLDPDAFTTNIQNRDAIVDLVLKIIQVNEAYFKKEKKKQSKKKDDNQSWFDSFQYLVSAGHRPDDILNMPYGAFTEYMRSAQRRESQRLKSIAIATRAAYHAKQNDFEKFISGLSC